MKKLLSLFACLLFTSLFKGQSAADAAVQISAVVQPAPAQITLSWIGNSTTTQYQVYRKLKSGTTWGSALAALSGTINQYVDNSVSTGTNYEYRVVRTGSGYSGYGYINCGIEVPEVNYRGRLILIVDSSFILPLSAEINRLITDIEGDGWDVVRHNVSRTAPVTSVRTLIQTDYTLSPQTTKAVFLLGHIPVPYSGNLNPDGHADHLGAWPADVYYGDVDGTWTDSFVNSTTVSPVRTQNQPGDGKFDQSLVPGNVELQVGRVDFNDMPTFTQSEQQLLKNYLDKDHEYRKKIYSPVKRAVIDDNFGYFSGEAFAASGYKNFSSLVGPSNVSSNDYFTTMTGNSYLWSFGCGGGWYSGAGGVGSTLDFASSNLQGTFTMLFGSYFGDWDSQDNFLRAALAQGRTLTNVWSGRPHYQFHHMALGENIGYSVMLTQNHSGGLYYAGPTGITGKWIQNALMGDPTLRNDVIAPVQSITATKSGYDCIINWSASTETAIAGYNLYMKNDSTATYVKLNSSPISGTSYTDVCLQHKGTYTYMVRVLKLENTPAGSYFNLSEGVSDTAYSSKGSVVMASFNASVTGNSVTLTNNSTNASLFAWTSGTTNLSGASASFTYNANGHYSVQLIASNKCAADTSVQLIDICNWLATASPQYTVQGHFVTFYSNDVNADSLFWDLGNNDQSTDADPASTYTLPGTYTVSLIVKNSCSSDTIITVLSLIDVGLNENHTERPFLSPNPTNGVLFIHKFSNPGAHLRIYDATGKKVFDFCDIPEQVDLGNLPKGVYFASMENSNELIHQIIILE